MSFQAMTWAIGIWGVSAEEKLVLIMLANNCAGAGCESSYVGKTLAVDCGMDLARLRRVLSGLAVRGLIAIGGMSDDNFILRYFINLSNLDKFICCCGCRWWVMKYTLSAVNQVGIAEHGLLDKTDYVDWVLLDYVFDWQTNPKARYFGNKVWLNFKHLIGELPLLGIKDKSAISRRFKKLRELNLLDTELDADGCLFARTSELYFEVTRFKCGDFRSHVTNKAVNPIVLEQHPIVLEQHPIVEQHPVVLEQHSTVIQDNSNTKYKNVGQLTAAHTPSHAEKTEKQAMAKKQDQELFAKFWAAYPKKRGKVEAENAWRKLKPTAQLVEVIIATINRALAMDEQWIRDGGQFIPNPATYLNKRRWEDEVSPVVASGGAQTNKVNGAVQPVSERRLKQI